MKCESLLDATPPILDEENLRLVGATIKDSTILCEIYPELQNLKPCNRKFPLDARMSIQVYYKNDIIDNICSDGFNLLKDGLIQNRE